jgi:SPP1 family predicted phage head-tail adaptor
MAKAAYDPGNMDDRIVIQTPTKDRDINGEEIGGPSNWSTYHECAAEVRTLQAIELWNVRQSVAEASHRIIIRYIAGVTSAMRIIWKVDANPTNDRILWIRGIPAIRGRNDWLDITCSEHEIPES